MMKRAKNEQIKAVEQKNGGAIARQKDWKGGIDDEIEMEKYEVSV